MKNERSGGNLIDTCRLYYVYKTGGRRGGAERSISQKDSFHPSIVFSPGRWPVPQELKLWEQKRSNTQPNIGNMQSHIWLMQKHEGLNFPQIDHSGQKQPKDAWFHMQTMKTSAQRLIHKSVGEDLLLCIVLLSGRRENCARHCESPALM